MMDVLPALWYPHYLMIAGAILVVVGFVGFAFRQNGNLKPDREPPEMKAKGK
jgi:hypothetical protein